MKRLLLALLLTAWAGAGWGAAPECGGDETLSLYVSTTGSNTSPYDTWAKAANDIATAMARTTALALGGTTCIYVAPGTYTGTNNRIYAITASGATYQNHEDMTITGALGVSPQDLSETARDLVVLNPGDVNSHSFYASVADVTVKNVTVKSSAPSYSRLAMLSAAANTTVSNCIFEQVSGGSGCAYSSGTGTSVNRTIFRGYGTSATKVFEIASPGAGTMSFSVLEAGSSILNATNTLYMNSTGTWNIYNSSISGVGGYGVNKTGSGTLNLYNCSVDGSAENAGVPTVFQAAGTLSVTDTAVWTATYAPGTSHVGGTVAETRTTVNPLPKYTSYGRGGYIIPCLDDATSPVADVAALLEPDLTARGFGGTWYLNPGSTTWDVDTNAATLQGYATAGVLELGSHTWSHNDGTTTTLGTLACSAGCSSPQYRINQTTDTADIDYDGDNVADRSYDFSAGYHTVAMWVADMTPGTWTFTPNSGSQHDGTLLNAMTDNGATWQSTGTALSVDRTDSDCTGDACGGFWTAEVLMSRDKLESAIGGGYVVESLANPYGTYDADLSTAARTAGYTSARNIGLYDTLASKNMYRITYLDISHFHNLGAAEITKRVNAIAHNAAQSGLIVFILSHGWSSGAWGSTAQSWYDAGWDLVLDALEPWAASGAIVVDSAKDVAATVTASPWSYDSGTGVTDRSYDTYSDRTPLAGSPTINAGTDLCSTLGGDQYDLAGVQVCASGLATGPWTNGAEIGAYGYVATGGGAAAWLGPVLGLY